MTAYTPRHALPYPEPGDPIHKGADQIRALADAIDTKLSGAGGGTVEGVVAPTPNTLAQRDEGGRLKAAAPVAGLDVANRQWVEGLDYATRAVVDEKIAAAQLAPGDGGGEVPALPAMHTTATADSLALRDAAGRTQVASPRVAADAANKGYVDSTVTSRVDNAGFLTSSALTPYATKTYVDTAVGNVALPSDVVREAALQAMRAELFGGSTRTRAPLAEIIVQSNIGVPAAVDWLCDNRWGALVDTDNGFSRSATNNSTYYRIPVTGRYQINYQLLHLSNRSGGSLKVLVNGTNIQSSTISSAVVRDSLEGPTMQLSTDYKFNAGDLVRWGYWYSEPTTIIPAAFGRARSRISLRYIGPV